MNSNSQGFSKALYKENIRRFWPISVAALMIWLVSGPFILLLQRNMMSVYAVDNMMKGLNFGFIVAECFLPVVMFAAIFNYLYKINSVNVMHALPFSRRGLFVTGCASGLTLSLAPMLITSVVLIAMKLANVITFRLGGDIEAQAVQLAESAIVWSVPSILRWTVCSAVIMIFIAAICSLSAVISGNGVINALTSCALNVVCPLIYLSYFAYADVFFYGYNGAHFNDEFAMDMHPVLKLTNIDPVFYSENNTPLRADMPWLLWLIYLAVAALIFFCAYKIYCRRANERTGDSYVFSVVDLIISLLMIYAGTSFVGLLFDDSFGSWGYLIGWVFSLIVSQMIVRKTARIFNREILKPIAASAVMMAIILGVFALDITGFEKRVPDTSKVDNACIYAWNISNQHSYAVGSEQGIADIAALHRDITEHKEEFENWDNMLRETPVDYSSDDYSRTSLSIEYALKNGKRVSRMYYVPNKYLRANENLRSLVSSKESWQDWEHLMTADYSKAKIWYSEYGKYYDVYEGSESGIRELVDLGELIARSCDMFPEEDKKAICEALYSDVMAMSFESAVGNPSRGSNGALEVIITTPCSEVEPQGNVLSGYSADYSCGYEKDAQGNIAAKVETFRIELTSAYPKTSEALVQAAKHFMDR